MADKADGDDLMSIRLGDNLLKKLKIAGLPVYKVMLRGITVFPGQSYEPETNALLDSNEALVDNGVALIDSEGQPYSGG